MAIATFDHVKKKGVIATFDHVKKLTQEEWQEKYGTSDNVNTPQSEPAETTPPVQSEPKVTTPSVSESNKDPRIAVAELYAKVKNAVSAVAKAKKDKESSSTTAEPVATTPATTPSTPQTTAPTASTTAPVTQTKPVTTQPATSVPTPVQSSYVFKPESEKIESVTHTNTLITDGSILAAAQAAISWGDYEGAYRALSSGGYNDAIVANTYNKLVEDAKKNGLTPEKRIALFEQEKKEQDDIVRQNTAYNDEAVDDKKRKDAERAYAVYDKLYDNASKLYKENAEARGNFAPPSVPVEVAAANYDLSNVPVVNPAVTGGFNISLDLSSDKAKELEKAHEINKQTNYVDESELVLADKRNSGGYTPVAMQKNISNADRFEALIEENPFMKISANDRDAAIFDKMGYRSSAVDAAINEYNSARTAAISDFQNPLNILTPQKGASIEYNVDDEAAKRNAYLAGQPTTDTDNIPQRKPTHNEAYYAAGAALYDSLDVETKNALYEYFWIHNVAYNVKEIGDSIIYQQGDGKYVRLPKANYEAMFSEHEELVDSLKEKYGDAEVERMLTTLDHYGDRMNTAYMNVLSSKTAYVSPIASSAASIPLNTYGGILSLGDIVAQNIGNIGKDKEYKKPVNYNSSLQGWSNTASNVRESVTSNILENNPGTAGNFLSLLYNGTMSIADSMFATLSGGKTGGTVLLFASGSRNGIVSAVERGASDEQALFVGLAQGAIEAYIERKFTIKKLDDLTKIPITDLPTYAKTVWGSTLGEGAEEGLTELAHKLTDLSVAIAAGDVTTSELGKSLQMYIDNGESVKEAYLHVIGDTLVDIATSTGAGMIGGLEMSATTGAVNLSSNHSLADAANDFKTESGKTDTKRLDATISEALKSGNQQIIDYANELKNKGAKVKPQEAALLHNMVLSNGQHVDFSNRESENKTEVTLPEGVNKDDIVSVVDGLGRLVSMRAEDAARAGIFFGRSNVQQADTSTETAVNTENADAKSETPVEDDSVKEKAVETPVSEPSATSAATPVQTPTVETPAVQTPVVETPKADVPVVDVPVVDAPSGDTQDDGGFYTVEDIKKLITDTIPVAIDFEQSADSDAQGLAFDIMDKALGGKKLSSDDIKAIAADERLANIFNTAFGTEIDFTAKGAKTVANTAIERGVSTKQTASGSTEATSFAREAETAQTSNNTVQNQNAVQSENLSDRGNTVIERMGATMGNVGRVTLAEMYDGKSDAIAYSEMMAKYYKAGLDGRIVKFDTPAQEAMYKAGLADAKTTLANDLKEEYNQNNSTEENNGEVHLRKGGERNNSENTGKPIRVVEKGSGRNQSGQTSSQPRDSEAALLTFGEKVSTASFGIGKGSTSDGLYRIADGETTAMKEAKAIAKKRGLRAVFFGGGNMTINGTVARGYISGDRVFLRVDDPEFTADQIMRHEEGHDKIAKGEINLNTVKERLGKIYGDEAVDFICQQYIEAYEGANLTPGGVFEEMVCDSLGDMNIFDSESEIREAADSFLTTMKSETEASMQAATNPDAVVEGKVSYGLNDSSKNKYDYFTLINKPDMTITVIDDTIRYPTGKEELNKARKDILKDALSNAAQIGYVNNSNQVFVRVNDIGTNVMLAKNGLKHGLDRRLQENAAATIKAGEILQNAIRINELTPNLETASGAYVLFGAAKNASNELYIIEFVVNKFDDKIISMDVLYSANAKKESAVQNAPESTENPLLVTDSTISIAQLLDFAREKFPDVLPESVLRHFGFDTRPEGKIGESALYSRVLPSDRTSKPLTTEQKEIWNRVKKMTPMQIANMTLDDADPLSKNKPKKPSGVNATTGKESKFYGSAMESDIFAEDTKQLIKNTDDVRYYYGISNETTLNEANDRLNLKGETEKNRFMTMNPQYATAVDVAEGFILLKRYQDKGMFEDAAIVAQQLREMGTAAGQTTQIFSILGRMTPEGMAVYAQKELDMAREELIKKHSEAWVEQRKDMFSLSAEEMQIIKEKMETASKLPDGRDKTVLIAEIATMLQEKLPKKISKQIQAYTRVCMLLNTKTMLRNIIGNAAMMPVYVVEDFVGATFDKALALKSGVRTKGNMHFNKATGKAALKGVYESFDDFRKHINTRNIQDDRFEIGDGDSLRWYTKKDFKKGRLGATPAMVLSNMVNAVDRITSFLLDFGDRPFFEFHFTNSINNQLRLNHATEPTADMIKIATAEALQRTWQDNNAYTKMVSGLRSFLNGGKSWGIGSIIVPFTKTPANLTKAIVDYSPAGLVKSITYNALKYSQSLKNKSPDPTVQKAFVDSFAKGVTGTIGYFIAVALAKKGLITGGDDDKDRDLAAFEKNIMGIAPYSVVLNGKSYSYDWAQPVGSILAVSADYAQNEKSGKSGVKGLEMGTYGKMILNALSSGGNVLFEQSFLQGVSELFGDDGLMGGLINSIAGAPTQFTSTALSQIAQMSDPYARTSYVYRDVLATAKNKVMAKIPGKKDDLAPVVDVLGHDVLAFGGNNSWYNVMFNPTNMYANTANDAAKEIYRVYEEVGTATVIPRVAPYYIEHKDERYTFTPHERALYQKAMGSTNERIVSDLINTEGYTSLDDIEKAEVLALVTDYSTAFAKNKYLKGKKQEFERDSWMVKAEDGPQNGISTAEVILAKAAVSGINKGLPDKNGETYDNSRGLLIMEAIYTIPNLSNEKRMYLFGCFGVGNSVIDYSSDMVESTLSQMRAKTY